MNIDRGVALITKAEYARRRGVAKSAVSKAVAENRITLIDGMVDPVVADIQWKRNTRARADSGMASTAELPLLAPLATAAAADPAGDVAGARPMLEVGYSEARARRERAEAEEAEMRTAKIRGTMVLREDVDRGTFEVLREARDRLTAAGRRLGSEVANLTSAEACEAVIDRELRIVLELMVAGFREKRGTAPKADA